VGYSSHTQDTQLPQQRRLQTRRAVELTASSGGAFLLMNAAATLIAGFGLFEDSPAVIIGAMLIAALLGPIQGVAMALAESDLRLLRVSLTAEILGAALVLALGIALGTIDRTSPLGHEILARTAPNILDLLIGLVGGAAASFAVATPRLGAMAVGVAIATALVPPLTTCGILIARGQLALAQGAFLLFFANFVAITFSAMVVFMILGHRATVVGRSSSGRASTVISRMVCLGILVVLGVHLFIVFQRTYGEATLRAHARQTVERELQRLPGSSLVDITIRGRVGLTSVYVELKSPRALSREEVGDMNTALNGVFGEPIDLHVRSEIVAVTTPSGTNAAEEAPITDPR
jgi:uncharacterized hydrophobic protein (TIGR00271 family)